MAEQAARGSDDEYCGPHPDDGHHYVSHSVRADPICWVDRCSLCGHISSKALREQLEKVMADYTGVPPKDLGKAFTTTEEGWHPTVREGETLEDVPLSQWIGEALGAVSMCWQPRPTGEFDSSSAGVIAEAVHGHVQKVIDDVIEGERQHSVRRATTRELLNELRNRSEAWAQVRGSGSGWLADWVDDAYVILEGSPMLDGGREP